MRAAVPRAGIATSAAVLAVACGLGDAGDPAPKGGLYFPTALALSADGSDSDAKPDYLFVANSNFDLRYTSGSVQAIDLAAVDVAITSCDRGVADCAKGRDMCRAACSPSDAGTPEGDAGADAGGPSCDRCIDRDRCEEPADVSAARDRICDDCFDACYHALEACEAAVPYDDGK